ncbi:hypothetical protein QBC44DRAFT_390017 [Cladorrhinum sp. PSN332]|nr:hypothetical protein QBC44DRAFT_390017 [Cladorrhinum sp. PSN332]
MSLPPFFSEDILRGHPPCKWDDFLSPQMRRFPPERIIDKVHFQQFLGCEPAIRRGRDYVACSAKVRFSDNPDGSLWIIKFFFDQLPPNNDPKAVWPMERQTRFAATLEKVKSGLAQAPHSRIYVPATGSTRRDCLRALYCFSDEGREARPFDSLPDDQKVEVFPWSSRTYECAGWIKVRGEDILKLNTVLNRIPWKTQPRYFKPDAEYFGLVYENLHVVELNPKAIQHQVEFFHHVGFRFQKPPNDGWRGPGILVHLQEYSSPIDRWFPSEDAYNPVLQVATAAGGRAQFRGLELQAEAVEKFERPRRYEGEGEKDYATRLHKAFQISFNLLIKERMGPIIKLAYQVEKSYQGPGNSKLNAPSPSTRLYNYVSASKGEQAECEIADDKLAHHIEIPEIEPDRLLLAWAADEVKKEQYINQVVSAATIGGVRKDFV